MRQHSIGFVPTESYIKMKMLALDIDTDCPSTEELYNRHIAILKHKPLIIGGEIPQKDLDWIFSKLSHKGLTVNTVVKDENQAK